MMKVLVLCVLVSSVVGQYRDPHAENYERPQPYSFGYDVRDEQGNSQHRREDGDEFGNKRGTYGYTDVYGVYRQVEYVADEHGFRATVRTNEPGTADQHPADVEVIAEEPRHGYSHPQEVHVPPPVYPGVNPAVTY